MYARWTADDFAIKYVLDGGTNHADNPSGYTYGVGVPNFEVATKPGHTFKGWYDTATGGAEVTNISTTATGDKTLYARWTADDFAIKYVLDGGSNHANNPNSYTYGVGVPNFESATKPNHTFLGWYDAATGGAEVTNISTTATGDKTLYARWTADDFAIKYVLDGGTNHADNPSGYTYGVGVPSFEPATKDGHIFLGWFDATTGGKEITAISETAIGAQTLYAHFKEDFTHLEVKPIVRKIAKNTTYTWQHTEHEPMLYNEDNQVVDSEIWAIVSGQVYSMTDFAELPEGVHEVTFTTVNPLLKGLTFNRVRASEKEVTARTTATIIAEDAPDPKKEPAPITVRYVDQNGKELRVETVYTGKIGDTIESLAPTITGYKLISPNSKINAVITDQIQIFTFVYKPITTGQVGGLTLPTTNTPLPKTGEIQETVYLLIGLLLIALASSLSWFKHSKIVIKEND
ncbi:hypothetical protein RyT2_26720 [Pseudolactococcus yaeyamensis]